MLWVHKKEATNPIFIRLGWLIKTGEVDRCALGLSLKPSRSEGRFTTLLTISDSCLEHLQWFRINKN